MNTEALRSILNSELSMLPHKFGDPLTASERLSELEEKLGIALPELFERQARLDRAKKKLTSSEFRSLLACYFWRFLKSDGFDYRAMEKEIAGKRKVLERHVGEGWVHSLSVSIKVLKELDKKQDEKPRGLLQVAR